MAIDEGTTSTRAIIFDHQGNKVAMSQREFPQYFPQPGWVEHDAMEIWDAVQSVISDVMIKSQIPPYKIASIGITNQRETTVIWDRHTGKPIYHAIVWQSKQTSEIAEQRSSGFWIVFPVHDKRQLMAICSSGRSTLGYYGIFLVDGFMPRMLLMQAGQCSSIFTI